MDFEEAKERLRTTYVGYGFEELADDENGLTFTDGRRDYPILKIGVEEIIEFADVADQLGEFSLGRDETCIIGPNLREQWVEPLDPMRSRFLGFADRNRVICFGDASGGGAWVEIGPPSVLFRNFYRDKGNEFPFFQERLIRRIGLGGPAKDDGMFRGILTARVCNLADQWSDSSLRASEDLIESALFELTYLKGIALELKSSWPISQSQRRLERRFEPRRRAVGDEFPLPKVKYDRNMTRFYQRAIASEDAYTSFISLYHILEYNFMSVADKKLYVKLERIVNDPLFSAQRKHLDRVIASVDEHGRENDETEMLKGVLSEYTDEDEILDFLQRQEDQSGVKLYTEKTSCFGYDLDKMTLKAGHIFGPVAKRIKTIRNALVHSSDRYERKERYVPGEEASRILARELPLLRHLAEKVIIATARTSA